MMNAKSITKTILPAGLLLAGIANFHHSGEAVTLLPEKDNSIFSEAVESNGQGIYLFVGRTNEPSLRRALLQFDVAGSIPAGATIDDAFLTLNMNKTIAGGQTVNLHRLLRGWGEGTSNAIGQEGKGAPATTGDATWLNAVHPSTPWTTAGGDFEATASASLTVSGNGFYTWSGPQLLADVQAWLDNPSSNFGWILVGPENVTSAKRFDSRESTVAENRPRLTITYTMPPPTWAGYPIHSDGQSVDTTPWIGWIDISNAPWIYVYDLNKYIYAPEQNVGPGGGWVWVGN
jgi:hypothetical protein